MLRRIGCLLFMILQTGWISPLHAQDTTDVHRFDWKVSTAIGINLSQSSFSANWAGGDKGSIVWVVNFDGTLERQFNPSFNLRNQLQLAYGQTEQQKQDPANPHRRIWDVPDKTTDLIGYESMGRWSFHSFVDPYLAIRLDSQFNDESNPIGRITFNPIKLKETAGIAHVLQHTDDREAITRLGFGFRQTFGRSFVDTTGTKKSFTSNDGGIDWQTNVTRPLLGKKVLYKSQLNLFQPIFYSKDDALEQFDRLAIAADSTREAVSDFWKKTDIGFLNTFSASITKHIGVILFAQWVYDKFDSAANVDLALPLPVLTAEIDRNVRRAGQFKETLALALTYQIF